MPQWTLQTLIDRAQISDLTLKYIKGLDDRDYDLVMSVLTNPFYLKMEALGIDRQMTPEEYALELGPKRFLEGFDVTMHLNTNHLITVDGDKAHIETKIFACHYIKISEYLEDATVPGLPNSYLPGQFIRCNMQMPWEGWATRQPDGEWRFHKICMAVIAAEGDDRVFAMSLKRSAKRLQNQ